MFLRQLTYPTPLAATLDRLESRGLARPILGASTPTFRLGPVLHTTSRCAGPGAQPHPATTRELVESPPCHKCQWLATTSAGRLLALASWWFALVDLTDHELDRKWRTAMLMHAAAGSAALLAVDANATHSAALDPLRRQVVARGDAVRDAVAARDGLAGLHRSLAAFAYAHPVSGSQARDFAKWAIATGTMQDRRDEHPVWGSGLDASLGATVQIVAVRCRPPLAWASSLADASDIVAVSEFFPEALLVPLTHGVWTGSVPSLTAAGFSELGFDVVAADQVPHEVLVMAAQLFDPSNATELGDLATALAAAISITR